MVLLVQPTRRMTLPFLSFPLHLLQSFCSVCVCCVDGVVIVYCTNCQDIPRLLARFIVGVRRCLSRGSLHLASPVVSIWIEDELRIVRERQIEDEAEDDDGEDGQPLQVGHAAALLMMRGEGQEDQDDDEEYLDSLADIHLVCFLVDSCFLFLGCFLVLGLVVGVGVGVETRV